MSIGSESPGGFVGSAHGYERYGNAALLEDDAKTFLLDLTDALRPLSDAAEIQMTASRMLCEHLGAGRALYAEIEGEPDAQVCVIRGQFVREGQPLPERMPYSEFIGGIASETLRRGQPMVVTDANTDPRFKAEARNAWIGAGVAAAIIVALVKHGREEVNFGVDAPRPREWMPGEVELVREVAERTWAVARRARAEAALRDSEEKYRSLFSEMVQGYAECELVRDERGRAVDYRFIGLNPAFERLVGIPVSRAIGRRGHEVLPGTEKWWPRTFDRIIKRGHTERVEHEVAPLGRWYEVYVYPHRNDRFTVFFDNITERKRAELALRESEERQAFLLKLSDELRSLTEPGEIQTQACRLLGEHLQVDRAYYVEINEREGHARIRHDYLRGGASISGDFRLVDYGWVMPFLRHGETVVVTDVEKADIIPGPDRTAMSQSRIRAHISMPLLKGGELVGALCVTESEPRVWSPADIELVRQTAERIWATILRARAETALRERETQLQHAARAKDEFLAMLGHELRNPLSPIATTLQLMKMRAPDLLITERGIIEKQARYLTDMVDDLLDVARIARGKVELRPTLVDVSEITTAASETVRPLLEEREQTLHVDVEPCLIVQADFRRLVQVVVNLLTNAAKYSPQGRDIHLDASAEGNEVVLRVRDEGVGIDPEMLPRVFDLFSQERQSLDRSRGGLGLGLAIVRNLVTLHGGSVSASSQGRDRGSEFEVRLPRSHEHAARPAEPVEPPAPEARAAEKSRSRPARVLVVDDYALAAESLAMLLQEFGFETLVAHDGATALAGITQFTPDIALIDIGLPVMDGYEVARAIRSMPDFEKLPLIAVTGYGQESDRARVKAAGFDEHLVKPINAERIGRIVEGMLGPPGLEPGTKGL